MPTIPEVDTKIDTDLPTNSVGQITASRLRGVLHYISSALGGATVTSGAVPEATRTVMQTLSFASPPDTIRTNGFNEVGVGAGLYTKAPGNAIPAHWPSSGVLTTGDGTNYLITPDKNELWVEQFGAKGRDNSDRTDQWQAFEDCKYVILLQADVQGWAGSVSSEGGTVMRIGRGSFYMTKSHSIEGGHYDVKGSGDHNGGTMIRTPFNVDGFEVQYNFGGQGQTIGHEGGPINAGARLVGNLAYVPGQTHVYAATNTGSPNPLAWPSGTGPGTITSGSATFNYVRELSWSETRGLGGDYAKISNLVCVGIWNPDIDGFDENQTAVDGGYHCGILFRARGTAENIACQSYAGHGICVAGDGGSECRGGGVPNNTIIRNYRGYYNGHDGLRIEGSDANACLAEIIDTALNKRSGVTDESLLGNRYVHLQSAFDGSPGNVGTTRYGACTHGGYLYVAKNKQLGSFRTVNYALEPGTVGGADSWIRIAGNGTAVGGDNYPEWTNLLFFQCAGGFISHNINAENQILGLYIEGGGYNPQLGLFDMAWGGAMGNTFIADGGANMYSRNKWLNRMMVQTNFVFDDGPRAMESFLGGAAVNAGKPSQAVDSTVWGYQDFENNTVRLHLEAPGGPRAYANADVYLRDDTNPNFIMGWTGVNTTRTFGQSGVQREVAYFPRLVLGSGGTDMSDTAAMVFQTTNSHLGTGAGDATGDRAGRIYFYANDPAPGDPWGWQVRHVSGNLRFIPLYP
jgi:hypothetical protein